MLQMEDMTSVFRDAFVCLLWVLSTSPRLALALACLHVATRGDLGCCFRRVLQFPKPSFLSLLFIFLLTCLSASPISHSLFVIVTFSAVVCPLACHIGQGLARPSCYITAQVLPRIQQESTDEQITLVCISSRDSPLKRLVYWTELASWRVLCLPDYP
ncbi:hypothetical protein V8F33_007427 [Rhypophila sp. PSN 637]